MDRREKIFEVNVEQVADFAPLAVVVRVGDDAAPTGKAVNRTAWLINILKHSQQTVLKLVQRTVGDRDFARLTLFALGNLERFVLAVFFVVQHKPQVAVRHPQEGRQFLEGFDGAQLLKGRWGGRGFSHEGKIVACCLQNFLNARTSHLTRTTKQQQPDVRCKVRQSIEMFAVHELKLLLTTSNTLDYNQHITL